MRIAKIERIGYTVIARTEIVRREYAKNSHM